MHIAILGRQPALGMAELEQLYGSTATRWFSDDSALVDSNAFDFERLGGTQKAGRVVSELRGDWRQVSMKLVSAYAQAWADHEGKITLGISAYGFNANPRDIQKTGIILKGKLKERGVSLRLIPNAEPALSSATSHHNKLGLSNNHVELLVVCASNGAVIIAESVGAQNITALAARDQGLAAGESSQPLIRGLAVIGDGCHLRLQPRRVDRRLGIVGGGSGGSGVGRCWVLHRRLGHARGRARVGPGA